MNTIADLENTHVLNFEHNVILPIWLPETLSLMVGAGDLDHGNMPNVQKFSTFDVFFCNAWDNEGSFRKNVEYLITHNEKKVICVVDHTKQDQVRQFVDLFRGRFHLIDGHLGHTPHLSLCNIQKLLTSGGRAMNIYERAESMVEVDDMIYWFEHGYFKKGLPIILLTSSMYKTGLGHIDGDERDLMRLRFLTKIQEASSSITYHLDLYELPLIDLQVLLYCLQLTLPLNLKGFFGYNKRVWHTEPFLELVLTKVEPYYGLEKIEACRDSELRDRALYIIDAIRKDIDNDSFSSGLKYKTLMRHLSSPKFEAACATE
jgi:hypothetical protein